MATPKKKPAKKKATKKLRAGRSRKKSDGLTAIQRQFLDALRTLGEVTKAAEAIGVSRQQHYRNWLPKAAYRKAFDQAVEEAEAQRKDDVRAEIHKAGFEGWEEEVIEQEQVAVKIKDASGNDTGETKLVPVRVKRRLTKKRSLSALLWEGNLLWGNPARVEVTGKDGGPVDHRLSVEAFRELAGL